MSFLLNITIQVTKNYFEKYLMILPKEVLILFINLRMIVYDENVPDAST